MDGKTLVEVRGLTKRFSGFVAVDDVSFDVREAEIVGLLGPNGAGKTTTLQMLLGLTTPDAGLVRLFGMDLAMDRERILSRVNFSSSYVALPFSLTVFENLLVFARLYGVKNPHARIARLLEVFEIGHLKDHETRRLSSGETTRVCLAKALINDPEVLFLDEPTASLDPDIADKTRTLLKEIRREKKLSILYTSHNMKEMEEVSDRIIFLEKGRILAMSTPEELKRDFGGATLEDVFLKIARRKA